MKFSYIVVIPSCIVDVTSLNSVYGLEEFVFNQELSNCNPNELDFS